MESAKMILVMTIICGICGLLLAGVKQATAERIEDQVMRYVKGPAVLKVLASATNNPVADRRTIELDGAALTVFMGKQGDAVTSVAYETTAQGFGGEIGIMVGYDLRTDRLLGIGVTSHKETPGVGARVTQTTFTDRFVGRMLTTDFRVKQAGGDIDALTGATISSKAACAAVGANAKQYVQVKRQIAGP